MNAVSGGVVCVAAIWLVLLVRFVVLDIIFVFTVVRIVLLLHQIVSVVHFRD